jgi:hypothetical protein
MPQHRVSCQREHDRYRVSEPARLDNHLAYRTHAALLLVQQVAQRADQFLASSAADTAALQQNRLILDHASEMMVDADSAIFVDDNVNISARLLRQVLP